MEPDLIGIGKEKGKARGHKGRFILLLVALIAIISLISFSSVGSVDATTVLGTPTQFSTSTTAYTATADLSSTSTVTVYCASSEGYAVISTISGISVTYGTPSAFYTSSTGDICVEALSSTSFIVTYVTSNDLGYAIIGEVSGTTISYGTAVEITTSSLEPDNSFDGPNIAVLSSTSVDISYCLNSGGHSYSLIGTISGTAISFGSAYQFDASYASYGVVMSALSSTSVVYTFREYTGVDPNVAMIATISGTSITYGSMYTLYSTSSANVASIAALSPTSFIVVYSLASAYDGYALSSGPSAVRP